MLRSFCTRCQKRSEEWRCYPFTDGESSNLSVFLTFWGPVPLWCQVTSLCGTTCHHLQERPMPNHLWRKPRRLVRPNRWKGSYYIEIISKKVTSFYFGPIWIEVFTLSILLYLWLNLWFFMANSVLFGWWCGDRICFIN